MHGILLTARPELDVNQRLADSCRALGLELEVVDGTRCAGVVETDGPWIVGEAADSPGVYLGRIGNWRPESMLAVAECLEGSGWRTPNPAEAVRVGRDHWRTCHRLTCQGLPVVRTVAGSEPEVLAAVAGERLGFPVVVKQRRSRMGIGVIRCEGRDHLEAVLDSLWRLGDEVVVQEWVASGRESHRLLVVDGEIVAAARFNAPSGEWRSNAARGGVASALEPSPEEEGIAQRAAAAVGLGVCGVDLLPGPEGPVVAEVNPSSGFRHLEAATGRDVASAIAGCLARLARIGDGERRGP